MDVVALAGGIGGGKFLRGLVRAVGPSRVTAIVNTGDDIDMHGLRVCPDLDSVTYWLGDAFDRERGWGRRGETFTAMRELARFDPHAAWFSLGDLDLATHLYRTRSLGEGLSLTEVTRRIAERFQIETTILPMSDDPVTTRIDAIDDGGVVDLHFQEYWVQRSGADEVKGVRFVGADRATANPAALEAIRRAEAVVFAPSNPVVSIGPILAIPEFRSAIEARRDVAVGISGIVAGAPFGGMADRLMPAVGMEVTAAGAAAAYRGLLSAWLIDVRDRPLASQIERELAMRVGTTDSLIRNDAGAERIARAALDLIAR